MASERAKQRLSRALVYFLLALLVVILAIPFVWTVSNAFKSELQANQFPPTLVPSPVMWSNFRVALVELLPFHIFFRNTIIIAVLVTLGEVLSCSFVAYGFAKIEFPGREALFIVLLSTMMLPFMVRMIPLFIAYTRLGFINTFYPLVLPYYFAGTPLFVFLLRQFYRTIPWELSDASRIDGASELRIWWEIMLPLTKPAMATIVILSVQRVWNDFTEPLIILRKTDVKTVMLGVYSLIGMEPQWAFVMAAVVASMIPMLIVFFVFQRYFVEGVAITGLKG